MPPRPRCAHWSRRSPPRRSRSHAASSRIRAWRRSRPDAPTTRSHALRVVVATELVMAVRALRLANHEPVGPGRGHCMTPPRHSLEPDLGRPAAAPGHRSGAGAGREWRDRRRRMRNLELVPAASRARPPPASVDPRHLLHEPVDRRTRHHDRQCGAAGDSRSFHASLSGLQWTIDAYTLVLASLSMLAGSTADRLGRRASFQTGLIVFSLGSLLCALAPSLELLMVFRIVQAIGGSMLNPVAMSIIRNVFDDPRERAQAIGMWGATIGLSMALGPVVGGALVDSVGWPSVFLVNVPVGAGAIGLDCRIRSRITRAPPAPRGSRRPGPGDRRAGVADLRHHRRATQRWRSPEIVVLFVPSPWRASSRSSATSCAASSRCSRSASSPARRSRARARSPSCRFAALGGFLFLNTLYLQDVRGLSPLHAGLYMLPMAGMTLVFAPLSGRLVGRAGLARRRWSVGGWR